jgi:hypothetical protein
MKLTDGATVAGGFALALAVMAMLWFALWPNLYQGVTATAVVVASDSEAVSSTGPIRQTALESSPPQTRTTASLVEVNGLWVISLLLLPVALAAIGLLSAVRRRTAQTRRIWRLWRTSGWTSAILLLLFCLAGAASIGMFFVPAAVAAIVGAVLGRKRQQAVA